MKSRRSRWDVVLGLTCVALLASAAVLAVHAHAISKQAHQDQAETASLESGRRRSLSQMKSDERRSARIASAFTAIPSSLQKLGADVSALGDAGGHFAELMDHYADRFNEGDTSGAIAMLEDQGPPDLVAVKAKQATVDADLSSIRAEVVTLQGALHG